MIQCNGLLCEEENVMSLGGALLQSPLTSGTFGFSCSEGVTMIDES